MSGSVVVTAPDTTVVVAEQERSLVITRGIEGPRGLRGEAGPAGGARLVTVGATPLSGHSAVAQDAGGLLVYADCTRPIPQGAALGLLSSAYQAGDDAVVQTDYDIEHGGWAWTLGPVFLGSSGALTQSPTAGAVFLQVIGWAVSAARIRIDIQPPVILS